MTVPPINLAQLRAHAERGNGDLYGWDAPAHEILLALIDTAEAADDFVDAHQRQRHYRGDYEWPGDEFTSLAESLARFTTS